MFNTALGGPRSRNAIFGKILAAINHAPGGSRIRVMSWNIMSRTAVDALLAAQRRGVKLRVLMDNTNLVDIPNPGFRRLKAGLKRGNQDRKQRRRSYAKTCIGSCRGRRGSAHTKVFLFSKTGSAHDVVMSGYNNLGGKPPWPTEVQTSFQNYLTNGGGFYVYHEANNSFAEWNEYNKMIALGWRNKDQGTAVIVNPDETLQYVPSGSGSNTSHGARIDVVVKKLGTHPIHEGLPRAWMAFIRSCSAWRSFSAA